MIVLWLLPETSEAPSVSELMALAPTKRRSVIEKRPRQTQGTVTKLCSWQLIHIPF